MTTLFTPRTRPDGHYLEVGVTILLAVVALAVSAFAAYSHNDKDLSNRMTAVEVQQRNDKETAEKSWERIERKLDNFIEYQTGRKP